MVIRVLGRPISLGTLLATVGITIMATGLLVLILVLLVLRLTRKVSRNTAEIVKVQQRVGNLARALEAAGRPRPQPSTGETPITVTPPRTETTPQPVATAQQFTSPPPVGGPATNPLGMNVPRTGATALGRHARPDE